MLNKNTIHIFGRKIKHRASYFVVKAGMKLGFQDLIFVVSCWFLPCLLAQHRWNHDVSSTKLPNNSSHTVRTDPLFMCVMMYTGGSANPKVPLQSVLAFAVTPLRPFEFFAYNLPHGFQTLKQKKNIQHHRKNKQRHHKTKNNI